MESSKVCFFEPDSELPKSITVKEAIARQNQAALLRGHNYKSDKEALDDFIAIHWAWIENKNVWFEKLEKFRMLKKGWNGYDADPPSDLAISNARLFLDACKDIQLEPTRLNPSSMEGIAIKFKNKISFFIEFYNNGSVWMMKTFEVKIIDDPIIEELKIEDFKITALKIQKEFALEANFLDLSL